MSVIIDGTNGITTPDLESSGPVTGTTGTFSGAVSGTTGSFTSGVSVGPSVTFGDATVQTTAATAPTTANVLAATAGASVGAVGTYAFLIGGGQTFSPGSNYAASILYYSSTGNQQVPSPRPSGTWKAMGGQDIYPTLFLRIS